MNLSPNMSTLYNDGRCHVAVGHHTHVMLFAHPLSPPATLFLFDDEPLLPDQDPGASKHFDDVFVSFISVSIIRIVLPGFTLAMSPAPMFSKSRTCAK